MPKNRRPDGWIVRNPAWEGTTEAQRRQAQDTWDLLAEQERANDLKEQELEILREMRREKFEEENNKFKSFQEDKAIERLEELGIDYSKLETLSELIGEGDILLRHQISNLSSEQIWPRAKIRTALSADQFLKSTLKWLGNIGLVIGLYISVMSQTTNITTTLILILLGYNFILDLGYRRRVKIVQAQIEQKEGRKIRPEKELREEEAKLNELLEESKQKYEKDFEDFRYKNFDREVEELILQLDYLGFKPLDMRKVKETKAQKQPYSEYINKIK